MEAKARSLITNKSIKVVSFDVFDTLLDRPVLKPTDIFYLVEKKVRSYLDNDPNFPFTEIRISAEKRAREKLKKDFPTYQDINFDEIYYQFQEITGLSHDQVENIKALELEVELKYLAPKKSVQLLYKLAVKHRKKIVILSDVYLPGEFLIKALKKNGYRDIDRYFVSSELRLTKVSGDLYPLMLKSMGVSPKEVVHIGDNKKADIRKANALAIQTVHIPKAVDLFFGGKCVDHIIWEGKLVILEPSMKIILGFIINKHFTTFPKGGWNNKSLFNGNEFLLGYYGVGPMMLMLVIWIIQHAKNNKVDVIAFAARDGYIPLKIFKMLEPLYDTLPEAIYLRASRSTCIPFDICTKADAFHALSCAHFNPDATALEVLKRRYYLNVTDEIIKHFLDYNIDLDKPVIDKDAFIDACLALGEPLLDGLKQQRELATEYYSEIFQDKKKIAIFDIGYRGRVQKSFSKYLDKDILGLYFSCFHEMASFDKKCIKYNSLYNTAPNKQLKQPVLYNAILEFVFSEVERGTVSGFTRNEDNNVEPIIEDTELNQEGINKAKVIHEGIMNFCREMITFVDDDLHLLEVSSSSAMHVFSRFMIKPHTLDAKMMNDISFGSYATGDDDKMLIGSDINQSYWREGFNRLNPKQYDAEANQSNSQKKGISFFCTVSDGVVLSRAQILLVKLFVCLFGWTKSPQEKDRMLNNTVDYFANAIHPFNVFFRRALSILGPKIPAYR